MAETFTALGTTPAPTFDPPRPQGAYTGAQRVILNDSNATALVYVSTDGSTPVPGSSPSYLVGMAIPVNASQTINSLAVAPGDRPSSMVSAAYTINPAPDFAISLEPPIVNASARGSGSTVVSVIAEHGAQFAVLIASNGSSWVQSKQGIFSREQGIKIPC